MKERDILKKIFCATDIYNHIIIASFIGMLSITSLNISSYLKGYGYSNLTYFFPVKEGEFVFSLIMFFILSIVMTGFLYKIIRANFSEKFTMPEISKDCFNIFFKIFPLQVVWLLYYVVFDYFANKLVGAWSGIILLGLFPFVNLIWIMFVRDFEMKSDYINPKFLFSIVSRTLLDIVRLSFFSFLMFLFAGLVSLLFFINSEKLQTQTSILTIRLIGICVGSYLLFITQYFFNIGLSEIVKDKFNNSDFMETPEENCLSEK